MSLKVKPLLDHNVRQHLFTKRLFNLLSCFSVLLVGFLNFENDSKAVYIDKVSSA